MTRDERGALQWGGSITEYERGGDTTRVYVPPEDIQDGPLDYYVTPHRPAHLIEGSAFRAAAERLWGGDDGPNRKDEPSGLCGMVRHSMAGPRVPEHYLETLAHSTFEEPDSLDPNLDRDPDRVAYAKITGAPTTVLGTGCGSCHRGYRARHEIDAIQDALITLTGVDPGPHFLEETDE